MNTKRIMLHLRFFFAAGALLASGALAQISQTNRGPAKITLEQAIQLAIAHNHALLAAKTTIVQNQALEVQANVRPNPTLFTDWEYLPLPGVSTGGGLAGAPLTSDEITVFSLP